MVLPVSTSNGTKIYNLSAGKTLPQWMDETKAGHVRSLRYNEDFRRRLELIQDFDFPTASQCIELSRNGKYIVASGVYRPHIKIYEVDQLSMKCERYVDAEVLRMQILSDDYSKLLLLRCDRTLEIHAKFGKHHTVRFPSFGRDLRYHFQTCDALIAGGSSQVYRFNLEQGQFLSSYDTKLKEINTIDINPIHQLQLFGGNNNQIEGWDSRDRSCVTSFNLLSSIISSFNHLEERLSISDCDVSKVKFDNDGITAAVGLSNGLCFLYDLRQSTPFAYKDHMQDYPIHSIEFNSSTRNVITSDKDSIRIWNRETGKTFASLQSDCKLSDLCCIPSSGLILAAGEQTRIPSYYIPSLGPAPRWCSFLDNLTEELEEQSETTIYDDYKFVTKEELVSLGLQNLIGTNLLRAYMHGYFIDMRLYQKVKAVANPFEYEQYVEDRIREKLKGQSEQRITIKRKLPKINREYAKSLLSKPKTKKLLENQSTEEEQDKTTKNPLGDERFASLFKDEDFSIDKNSEEYKRLHPSSTSTKVIEDVRLRNVEGSDEEDEDAKDEIVSLNEEENSSSESEYEEKIIPKKNRQSLTKSKRNVKLYEAPNDSVLPFPEQKTSVKDLNSKVTFAARLAAASKRVESKKEKEKEFQGKRKRKRRK